MGRLRPTSAIDRLATFSTKEQMESALAGETHQPKSRVVLHVTTGPAGRRLELRKEGNDRRCGGRNVGNEEIRPISEHRTLRTRII